jgi:hypothetical protein
VLGRRAVKDRVAERRHDQTAWLAFGFETKVRFDPGVGERVRVSECESECVRVCVSEYECV